MSIHKPCTICFFEDEIAPRFYPLALTRPIDDLRTGILTLREKWLLEMNAAGFYRLIRPELQAVFGSGALQPAGQSPETATDVAESMSVDGDDPLTGENRHTAEKTASQQNTPHTVCWINSRLLPDPMTVRQLKELPNGVGLTDGDVILAWKSTVQQDHTGPGEGRPTERPTAETLELADGDLLLARHLWDLIRFNGPEIERDMERLGARGVVSRSLPGVHFLGEHPLHVSPSARVEPEITLVTLDGPIYIGDGAHIMAGATLRGPVAIAERAIVRMGARIYENSSIGPLCKVAGEIQSSIFHSYSNKAHDGFVGSSLIGQWCNLGAGTTTSNLKNNYSTVRIREWEDSEERDTGEQFIGTFMGDHSRTGIHTMMAAGTKCGVSCNLFGSGFMPRRIPSFSWVDSGQLIPYHFEKAVETMRRVMARRGHGMDEPTVELMRMLFEARSER